MDTSTSTTTHINDTPKESPIALLKTSSAFTDRILPGPGPKEWFDRLVISLSPLTHSSVSSGVSSVYSDTSSPESTSRLQPPLPFDLELEETQLGKGIDQEAVFAHSYSDPGSTPERYPNYPDSTYPHRPLTMTGSRGLSTMLLIFVPVLVVVLTVLIGLICFLVAVILMKRRKGVRLLEDGGPLDLSKGDGVIGEGGVEGVETRWLETVEPDVQQAYKRAKEWQEQYPPSSVPTDITLSQFLSIQEKGVSAWSFEPDYEDNLSLYVQSRTEITFLSDGPGMAAREGGGNNVMANLPLPKLNEVYYWEVKLYEKPTTTEVAIGLATKPYPSFRLPGWNRHSIAYFASDGFKSHNYPFTAASYGPPLNEGDVLGVGYRPRTGTVFFTRNGRKLDDAYTGLQRLNLFPIVGANGSCTLHVNLGQAGFVFIEANVKKWGLAPMTGTLAPPPAYGSERGSILLDAGYGTPGANTPGMGALMEAARARAGQSVGPSSPARSSNSSRRHRRAGRSANLAGSVPTVPSPLRASEGGPGPTTAGSRRRVLGRAADGPSPSYISPTDTPEPGPRPPSADALEHLLSDDEEQDGSDYDSNESRSEAPSSPMEHNPPTPNLLDISMHSLRLNEHYFGGRRPSLNVPQTTDEDSGGSGSSTETARPPRPQMAMDSGNLRPREDGSPPPPGYAPLDPNVYAGGLPADLPEEMVNQAIAAMSAADQNPNGQGQNGQRVLQFSDMQGAGENNEQSGGRFPWPFSSRRG